MSHGLRSRPQVRGVVQGASVSVLSANGVANACTQHVFISPPPPFFVVFLFMCALASSGGGEVASEHEGAASHMALEGHATESEYTSGTEGEGSSTAGTRADISDSDSSSEGSSLVVAATSVSPATTGAVLTVVFCTGVRAPGRGAGRQSLGGCGVRVPCCPDSSWGERFPFEMAVSAVFLSAGLPPRKRWRIGGL
ncbi:hypothetical protein NDU88_011671 [Pleurodeles waltl]|uniref:Uncharacterized protein n=1 Tax=Pleurodeles waltl TaxID=8319 RepID=A0AAV7S2H8_PLEWA|nr:hypothetical protein NDU88_011671 [Pleurodeles waltl]